ncbi:hypothetical protein PS732_01289 [Pseudomonas fluorescens]|uniref:Uncharacterized protein n=1 Tax=Pseudomonas fluorescens TaxID=294 RepID=A0ABD7VBY9_PSEFL|nr:hypothetical protein PS732_01289 [Pseudomonas fluorescens]
MQVRDHLLELGDLATGQITRVRGEERDAVVAPVIGHALVQQMLVVNECVDRQQLHRRHPDAANVLEHVVIHQTGEGATHVFRHRRMPHADAAHMGLIDDGFVPRHADALVVAPGVGRVDDLALGHERGAVAFVETEVGVWMADGVAEQCFRPFQFANQLFGVGVDQQFVVVETVTVRGVIRPINAVAVDHPRVRVGQVAVIDLVGVFREFDAFELDFACIIEDAQFNLGGVGGEQGKVHPQAIPGRAEREGQTLTDSRWLGVCNGLGFIWTGHDCSCKIRVVRFTQAPVGASLFAKAVGQLTAMSDVPTSSRAGSLPQVFVCFFQGE